MKKICTVIFLTFCLFAYRVDAYTYRGAPSCSDWFTLNESSKTTYRYWLLSYVSGLNVMNSMHVREKTGKDVDVFNNSISNDRIFAFIDRFCKDKPNENIADGGFAAFYFFQK